MVSPSKSQQQQQQQQQQRRQQQQQQQQQQQPQEQYELPYRENNKRDTTWHVRIQRGPKPLEKKSFYLDIKNHIIAAKIETRIKDLGGSIEVFLVRGVSLVASDRVDRTGYVNCEKRKWGFTSGGSGGFPSLRSIEVPTPTQTPPTPFFSSECPLSNSTNLRGSTVQRSKSRVDAMLERALIQPQQYSVDPLDNAQAWGIPIWAVEKLQGWLEKISASIKDTGSQCQKHSDQNISTKDTKIRHLKGPFLKFESYHRNTRAVFFEIPTWPKLNLYGEPGFCPFDTKKRETLDCCKQVKKREIKENRQQLLDLASRGQHKDMTRRQRTTTARTRRTEHLTSGYCEICRTEYRDLSKHVQSDQHLAFVRNDDNFLSLDRLINAGANVEAFLKLNRTPTIERDCSVFPSEENHGLDGVVAESKKGLRDSKSLALESYTVAREIKMVQCNGTRRNVETKLNAQPHNLRTRLKHESGHLLRSKGSPWHELDKSDKFYEKFEGFTVKKRAKGTIWIEEEDHPDTQGFLQHDAARNDFSNLAQEAYAIVNYTTRKTQTSSERGLDANAGSKKKDDAALFSVAKSIVRLREQSTLDDNLVVEGKQNREIDKLNARVNGGDAAAAAAIIASSQIADNESPKDSKPLTVQETLAVTSEKFSRQQLAATLDSGLCNGNWNEKNCQSAQVQWQGQERVQEQGQKQKQEQLGQEQAQEQKQKEAREHEQVREEEQGQEQRQEREKVSVESDRDRDPKKQHIDKNADEKERVTAKEACIGKNKEKQAQHPAGQRNGGKSGIKWSRRGGRHGMRARHRLSVEERLIEDNRAYYKVEVLGSKLRSSALPAGSSTLVCSSLSKEPLDDDGKNGEACEKVAHGEEIVELEGEGVSERRASEAPSSEKPVVVRFKRVRKSELSLLSDEAESFMFGEQKRDNSSESSDDEEQSSILPRETEPSEREDSGSSMLPSSLSDSSVVVVNSAVNRSVGSNSSSNSLATASCSSSPTKLEVAMTEDDSQDSLASLGRARKRRRTQAEALIKDNTDYYKFETPGSRLRYQGSPGELKHGEQEVSAVSAEEATKKLPRQGRAAKEAAAAAAAVSVAPDPPEKVYPSKPSAEVEKLQFSFEAVPRSEPWYQTYQRQDQGAEYWHYFSESDVRKPFLLPYEIENFHELLSRCQSRIEAKRKGRGRTIGGSIGGRSPRKSPRCHASTLAIMSTIIRKKEQQQHTEEPGPILSTIDENDSWPSSPAFKDISAKSERVDGELKAMARTIDEMLDARDTADMLEPFPIEPGDSTYQETNIYEAGGIPRGPPANLLELLDNCHEIVNCLENSSCASSECGEGNVESPLKRRKKRKNRTGWPGIKLKRKLQHNKSSSEVECERENQSERDARLKSVETNNAKNSTETLGDISVSIKVPASDCTILPPSHPRFSFAEIPEDTPRKCENPWDDQEESSKCQRAVAVADFRPGTLATAAAEGTASSSRFNDENDESDVSVQPEYCKAEVIAADSLDDEGNCSISIRSTNTGGMEVREGSGGPLTERDAAPSKDYNVHRNGAADIKTAAAAATAVEEVSEYELGNDENHENQQQRRRRRLPTKVSIRKRHRDNTSSSDVREIHHELDKCEPSDCDQGVHAGSTTIPECEIERRHSAAVFKRNNRVVASRKRRRIHSPKKRSRKDSIRCAADTVFENENCKEDSYLSLSYGKQPEEQEAASPKTSKHRGEPVASAAQETEVDTPLSERISSRLVSSSELEQKRSSIDFQPVVRMMKIDEQVDVDHGILSVTVASNRRLRSSSSPRSSNPPPKKRLKTSANRGQTIGRLLKGS